MRTWRSLSQRGAWLFATICICSQVCCLLPVSLADEATSSARLKLFRPDALVGWQYGPGSPQGWTIERGVLRGDHHAPLLQSAWTFGDFDLEFAWNASADGAWEIQLPIVEPGKQPDGKTAVRVLLKGSGEIELLAPGANAKGTFDTPANSPWRTSLRRQGQRVTVQVGSGASVEVTLDEHARLGLALKIATGSGTLQELTLSEPAGESIFNGRDLTGWWTPGNLASWKVDDGQIVCLNKDGNYLRTEKEFGNFTLALDYRMNKSVNSGVGIRTPRAGWPSSDGIEIQLEDKPGQDKHSTMALYGNLEPLARADRSRQWNHAVVKAEGHIVTGWMNGELVQHADTSTLPELKHRQLSGWIGLQDHGGRIWVRNMSVLESPPGENPHLVGKAPYVATQPERVLDRLMNSRVLAERDGLQSDFAQGQLPATISASSSDPGQLVTELIGPACLVSLWLERAEGTLAFYFDGQSEPRFTCAATALAEHVPRICEDASPFLTCVPFAKSLKIVRTSGPECEFRVEYVRFATPDASATDTKSLLEIPRGALSAVDYRYHRLGGGTLRDLDPYKRLTAAPRAIEPGSSSTLLSADGAGTLLWLKLIAAAELLQNNDLWLEATVDGESKPAVSAPARFWFPALAGGNHDNFTQVSHEGLTTLLAMPFGRGLTVAARNVGTNAIEGIGAAACIEQNSAAPMRLRGAFSNNGDANLFSYSGRGRWIGLVCDVRTHAAPALNELKIDGHAATSWRHTSAAQFWGPAAAENEVFTALGGRSHGLVWRYLLLAPVEFTQSIQAESPAEAGLGERLALFYVDTEK